MSETIAGQDMGPQPTNPGYDLLSYYARNDPQGLKRLRQVVRKVHFEHCPGEVLTDYTVDQFIAAMLPETIEGLIKRAVDERWND